MAYAVTDDVLARAGRVGGAFSVTGKRPNATDLSSFLTDTAAELDAAIRARGFDPAAMNAAEQAAWKDLNAYGALYRAVAALGDATPQATRVIQAAQEIWEDAMGTPTSKGSIAMGTFPAILALEAGQGGAGTGSTAGSLWTEEPSIGSRASVEAEALQLRDTNLAPLFSREMSS